MIGENNTNDDSVNQSKQEVKDDAKGLLTSIKKYLKELLDFREDTDQEIRKKWINLNKEHHPDNLIAKGMPKEFIEQSNKELAAINIAYDKIKEIRAQS